MANVHLYFDNRVVTKKGTGTIKMQVTHKHLAATASIGIHVRPDEWSKEAHCVIKRDDRKMLNIILRKRLSDAELALQRLMLRDDYESLTAKQMLTMIMRGTDTVDDESSVDYVLPTFNEYILLAKGTGTKVTYRTTLRNLMEFTQNKIDSLTFKDINVAWLRKYQNWLYTEKQMSVNGANVYLRNLRTIFNFALKNEITSARYPFRDIDMATTEPAKTSIPLEKFIEWYNYPLEAGDYREKYRDLFMLAFYLRGIRPIDLLYARKDQVDNGRLVYYPHKLGGKQKLSVKIEPEAWELIRKYEGKRELLLEFMESRQDYNTFLKHWNIGIKSVGDVDKMKVLSKKTGRYYDNWVKKYIVPYITPYYARICWASYSYNHLDLSMDLISQALGHKNGARVTNFYVKREERKVDEANRRLIDFMNEALKNQAPPADAKDAQPPSEL